MPRWAVLLAGAMMLAVVLLLGGVTVALGAEPSFVPAGVLEGGDPRSEGAAPGLVGSPVLVLLGVVTLGLATALVTAVIVRLSRRG
jgi:hypothetical protein